MGNVQPAPPPVSTSQKSIQDHSVHVFLEELRGVTFGEQLAEGKFYAEISCPTTAQTYFSQVSSIHAGNASFIDSGHCWRILATKLTGNIVVSIFEKGFLPWGTLYGRVMIPLESLADKKESTEWYTIVPDEKDKKGQGSATYLIVSGEVKVRVVNNLDIVKVQKRREKKHKHRERKKKTVRELYEFGPILGRGAHGVVRLVTEKSHKHRKFACKVLSKVSMDADDLTVLHREVKLHKTLKHDHIIRLREVFETEAHIYIIMELVEGGELFDLVAERGFLEEDDAAMIINQLVQAVAYMHSNGIVHRDLKPENVLCTRSEKPQIKIIDFGASKSTKDRLQTFVGTPSYLSPEVVQGKPYGPEVDIWAIGVIAYIVLSGFQPFEGDSMAETMTNIMAARYTVDVPEFEPVSDEAKDFIKIIFKANPAERPTAAQLLQHKWLAHFNQPSEQPRPRSMRKLASVGHIKVRQQIRHDAIAKRSPHGLDDDIQSNE